MHQAFVTPTQQLTERVLDNSAALGASAQFQSPIILNEGFGAVHILSISNVPGTVRVTEFTNENDTVGVVTNSIASTVDAVTGNSFVAAIVPLSGRAVRITYVNGGSVQTTFRIRAYLLPISTSEGAGITPPVVDSLQTSYGGGSSIITTAAGGPVSITRGPTAAAGDPAFTITDANASPGRTVCLQQISDANTGPGDTFCVTRTAGTGRTAVFSRTVAGVSIRSEVPLTTSTVFQGGLTTPTTTSVIFGDGDTVLGGSVMAGTERLRVVGDARVEGKLTVTGVIDPTAVILSDPAAGTALYFESFPGQTAPVSGATTGRIRYNNVTATWQVSVQGGAYVDLATGTSPVNAFVQDGNSFGAVAVLGTNDAFDLTFETAGVTRGRFLGSGVNVGQFLLNTTTGGARLVVEDSAQTPTAIFRDGGASGFNVEITAATATPTSRIRLGSDGGNPNTNRLSIEQGITNATIALSPNTAGAGKGSITISADNTQAPSLGTQSIRVGGTSGGIALTTSTTTDVSIFTNSIERVRVQGSAGDVNIVNQLSIGYAVGTVPFLRMLSILTPAASNAINIDAVTFPNAAGGGVIHVDTLTATANVNGAQFGTTLSGNVTGVIGVESIIDDSGVLAAGNYMAAFNAFVSNTDVDGGGLTIGYRFSTIAGGNSRANLRGFSYDETITGPGTLQQVPSHVFFSRKINNATGTYTDSTIPVYLERTINNASSGVKTLTNPFIDMVLTLTETSTGSTVSTATFIRGVMTVDANSNTVSGNIVSMSVDGPLATGGTMNVYHVVDAGITQNSTSTFRGLFVDFSTAQVSVAGAIVEGVRVTMPAVYGAATEVAGQFNGDGRAVELCTDTLGVDVTGDYGARETAATLANGDNNNVSTVNTSTIRITGPTAGFATTGFANGVNGKRLFVYNSTAQIWTISHQSASSAVGNRIITNTGADVLTVGVGMAIFYYSSVDTAWILMSFLV